MQLQVAQSRQLRQRISAEDAPVQPSPPPVDGLRSIDAGTRAVTGRNPVVLLAHLCTAAPLEKETGQGFSNCSI